MSCFYIGNNYSICNILIIMDLKSPQDLQMKKSCSPISEFSEARKRFEELAENRDNLFDDSNCCYADEIIEKLCSGDGPIDIQIDSRVFYALLFRSDYLQIKNQVVEQFYSNLCTMFILSDAIDDIIANLGELELIPHVKQYLAQGFCKVMQIAPVLKNDYIILRYSEDKNWHELNMNRINFLQVSPCAYKSMLSNEKFNLSHLNFLLKIFKVERLNLNGCKLNGRNAQNLFNGLKLKSLHLSHCGTSVNRILQNNSDALKDLKHLDVSYITLHSRTLKKLRHIPLKTLNLTHCIKSTTKSNHRVFKSIWVPGTSYALQLKPENTKCVVDHLWSAGILKETLEVLDISSNCLRTENLQEILKLNLIELGINRNSEHILEFSKLTFPDSLRVLRVKGNVLKCDEIKSLCDIKLNRLELDYYGNEKDDFSKHNHLPLSKSLRELSVNLHGICQNFISFISDLRLKYFKCNLGTSGCFIDPFIINHAEARKNLEVLIVKGTHLNITNNFELETRKMNLKRVIVSRGLTDIIHALDFILSF